MLSFQMYVYITEIFSTPNVQDLNGIQIADWNFGWVHTLMWLLLLCCVFQPAFECCAHPKTRQNTFLGPFSTFSVISPWNQEKTSENEQKTVFFKAKSTKNWWKMFPKVKNKSTRRVKNMPWKVCLTLNSMRVNEVKNVVWDNKKVSKILPNCV